MLYRGAFHAHSTFSYDGKDSLPALVAALAQRGFHFLLLTEHDDSLSAEVYQTVVEECTRLSGPGFLVVPGLEIRCWKSEKEQWHIAAAGVRRWIPRGAISEVVSRIHAAGGLAILLHPFKYTHEVQSQELLEFDGVELWNGKFDGFYAPQNATLRLVRDLVHEGRHPHVFYGHDLHGIDGIMELSLELELPRLTEDLILEALRRGEHRLGGRGLVCNSQTGPGAGQRLRMRLNRAVYAAYAAVRRLPLLGPVLGAGRKAFGPGKEQLR